MKAATSPDGQTVEVNEDFDATLDVTGRFPVGPDYWTFSEVADAEDYGPEPEGDDASAWVGAD